MGQRAHVREELAHEAVRCAESDPALGCPRLYLLGAELLRVVVAGAALHDAGGRGLVPGERKLLLCVVHAVGGIPSGALLLRQRPRRHKLVGDGGGHCVQRVLERRPQAFTGTICAGQTRPLAPCPCRLRLAPEHRGRRAQLGRPRPPQAASMRRRGEREPVLARVEQAQQPRALEEGVVQKGGHVLGVEGQVCVTPNAEHVADAARSLPALDGHQLHPHILLVFLARRRPLPAG